MLQCKRNGIHLNTLADYTFFFACKQEWSHICHCVSERSNDLWVRATISLSAAVDVLAITCCSQTLHSHPLLLQKCLSLQAGLLPAAKGHITWRLETTLGEFSSRAMCRASFQENSTPITPKQKAVGQQDDDTLFQVETHSH